MATDVFAANQILDVNLMSKNGKLSRRYYIDCSYFTGYLYGLRQRNAIA